MDGNELISFQIISAVGTARSLYVEAIQEAKKGNIEAAKQLIEDGVKVFVEGHHAHASLIQQEAAGEKLEFSLLLMHAEDQLMTTETLKIVAEEFIEIYNDKFNN
ncbi:MAG: PTS lactose/cellobiose transporter subunit IIA [Turicibacter sp.]|nr:PTS lactose/cellobiose transporter subunit IIA [Turicibacter sp.]